MSDKKLACFTITGELLLEILKEKTDLPDDAELILLDKHACPIKDKKVKEFMETKFPEGQKNENFITFIITSEEFWIVENDNAIPVVSLKSK